MKDFTRPGAVELEALDLNALVRDTTEFVTHLRGSRSTTFALDLDDALPAVRADRVQIQQVLVNLMQNGIDALQAGGGDAPTIVVTTERCDGYAEVAVRDNSDVEPPEDPEALFETFFTTKQGGMGIGLSLCRSIIHAHGGAIVAEPNADRGMTFRFSLPFDSEAHP